MDFHYLDSIDLPSDTNGSLGKLRRELMKVYNSNRTHPDKMKLLKENLLFIIKMIDDGFSRELITHEQQVSKDNQEKINNIDKPKQTKPKPKSKLSNSPVRGRPKATKRAAKRTKTGNNK